MLMHKSVDLATLLALHHRSIAFGQTAPLFSSFSRNKVYFSSYFMLIPRIMLYIEQIIHVEREKKNGCFMCRVMWSYPMGY